MPRPRVQYCCDNCHYITNRKDNYEYHMNRQNKCKTAIPKATIPVVTPAPVFTPSVKVETHNFTCQKCSTIFSTLHGLGIHSSKCTGLHPLKCPTCNYSFSSKQSKSKHIKRGVCNPIKPASTILPDLVQQPETLTTTLQTETPIYNVLESKILESSTQNQINIVVEIRKKPIKEKPKPKLKTKIPLSLRFKVWDTHIGINNGKAKCACCEATEITQLQFECGHIIPESNGGPTILENLLPICMSCNRSMHTINLYEFKRKHFVETMNEQKEIVGDQELNTF